MTIHSGSWSGWTKTSDAWAPWRSRSAPLFVVACLSLIAPAAALGQTFASPGNLSNTSGQPSTLPDIASTGNKVYVVWREEVLSPSFTFIQQIRVRASADGGESFSDGPSGKVILEASLGQTIFAVRVAAFGNNVYVLAAIGLPGGKPFLARSTDNGANFSGFALLPSGSGLTNFSLDIAVDGAGQVHVVMEDTGATNDILYERSTDGGLTFSAPLNIANTANDSFVPAIAASGASVAVVWHDIIGTGLSAQGEVQFVSSNNAGTSFSAPQNLSGSSVNSISADVAANGGFHVVWAEGGAAVYRRSSDGIGFMPAVQLGTVAPGGSLHNPRIAVSGPDVGVVWTTSDLSFNVQGPFFRRSADGGGSFNLPQDLSAGLTGTRVVTVALSAGSPVKVVWPHASSGLFVDTDVLLRREVVPFAGGPFDGGGQSDEVDSFLTYTSPFESRTMLPVGTTSFSVKIIYSPTIIPSTLEASLNGAAFGGFTAIPGATQTVSVPLAPGRNVLVLKVRGLTASGRNAGDQDRLTFIVD